MSDQDIGSEDQNAPDDENLANVPGSSNLNSGVNTKGQTTNSTGHASKAGNTPQPTSPITRWQHTHNKIKEAGFHDWVTLLATVAIAVSTICYTDPTTKQLGFCESFNDLR